MEQICKTQRYKYLPSYHLQHISGVNINDLTLLPLHYDADVALCYFRKGSGSVRIEGCYYPIETGDIVLLNPQELHCFTFHSGINERIVLHIKEDLLHNFHDPEPGFFNVFYRSEYKVNHICSETAKQNGIDSLFEQILLFSEEDTGWNRMLAICRIVELISAISHIHSANGLLSGQRIHEDNRIHQILQYINKNLLSIQDIESISAHFFLNKSYLCRLFKSHVGTSLWNYVILRRLLYCNDLIRNGTSIENACYQSGFQNYSNFFRLYKKNFGVSPSDYHHSNQQ